MAKKSDVRKKRRRVSATEASRSFSRMLDDVEHGAQFTVYRQGGDICEVAPPNVRARRASECLELLRARAPVTLDGEFAADLRAVIVTEPGDERPSLES